MAVSSERLARKERSGSFGSSFKKLFGSKKKKEDTLSSRENSASRATTPIDSVTSRNATLPLTNSHGDNYNKVEQENFTTRERLLSYQSDRQHYAETYQHDSHSYQGSFQEHVNGNYDHQEQDTYADPYGDSSQYDDSYRLSDSDKGRGGRGGEIEGRERGRGRVQISETERDRQRTSGKDQQRGLYNDTDSGDFAYSMSVPAKSSHLHEY